MCQVKNGQKKNAGGWKKKTCSIRLTSFLGPSFSRWLTRWMFRSFQVPPGRFPKSNFFNLSTDSIWRVSDLMESAQKKSPPPPRFLRRLELKCFFFILKPLEHIGFKCPPLKKGNHLIAGFSGLPSWWKFTNRNGCKTSRSWILLISHFSHRQTKETIQKDSEGSKHSRAGKLGDLLFHQKFTGEKWDPTYPRGSSWLWI